MHQYVHKKSSAAQEGPPTVALDRRERARGSQSLPKSEPSKSRAFLEQQDSKDAVFHHRGPFSASSYSESSEGDGPVEDTRPPTSWIADPHQKSPRAKFHLSNRLGNGSSSESVLRDDHEKQASGIFGKDSVLRIADDSYPNTTSGIQSEFEGPLESRQGLNQSPTEFMQLGRSNRHNPLETTHIQPKGSSERKDADDSTLAPAPDPVMTISFKGKAGPPAESRGERDLASLRKELGKHLPDYSRKARFKRLPNSLKFMQAHEETKFAQHAGPTGEDISPSRQPTTRTQHDLDATYSDEGSPTPATLPGNTNISGNDYYEAPWRARTLAQTQTQHAAFKAQDEDHNDLPSIDLDEQDAGSRDLDEDDKERAESMDYGIDELKGMDVSTLRNQPFDFDPSRNVEPPSEDQTSSPLHERLTIAARSDDEQQQQDLLDSLSMAEWEQAGEWFTERFADLNRKLRKSRQERRRLAKSYEDQLWTHYDTLMSEHESIDDTFAEMRKSGNAMLAQATPKRKYGPS